MKSNLLAFVHIEKAAGTTLNHILRRNYFLSYMDVRPFHKKSNGLFSADDYRIASRIVPGLKCISGHSVKPFGSLESINRDIHFIALLRNPVDRYLSQYMFWVNHMGKSLSFEDYLALEKPRNFQTKKISEKVSVEQAIMTLENKFLLVGIVEEFDEFLVMLRKKLSAEKFDPSYHSKNVGMPISSLIGKYREYKELIVDNNRYDIEVYNYVKSELRVKNIRNYGDGLGRDLEKFVESKKNVKPSMLKLYIDFIQRKFYIDPLVGIVRMLHGLPYKGSY